MWPYLWLTDSLVSVPAYHGLCVNDYPLWHLVPSLVVRGFCISLFCHFCWLLLAIFLHYSLLSGDLPEKWCLLQREPATASTYTTLQTTLVELLWRPSIKSLLYFTNKVHEYCQNCHIPRATLGDPAAGSSLPTSVDIVGFNKGFMLNDAIRVQEILFTKWRSYLVS